jgi:polynucleotide 5'-hydroxyl-kinase GRC3/NOL9
VFLAEIQGGFDTGHLAHDCALPIPLIVNTQGWVRGLGADLSDRISEIINPSHIFAFGGDGTSDPFESNNPGAVHRELEAISAGEAALKLNASDARGLSLMSYFHSTLDGENIFWTTNSSLCSMSPWEIQCRSAIDYVALSGAEGDNVVPEELENALTGSVVGLIRSEIQDRREINAGFPYIQGGELPPPVQSECIGVALVRHASSEEGVVHLVTPVDGRLLVGCRILVKGDIELPVPAMLRYELGVERNVEAMAGEESETLFGVEHSRVPFLQWAMSVQGAGASKRRARRNVMRRGQV